jgi:hypothetical protein
MQHGLWCIAAIQGAGGADASALTKRAHAFVGCGTPASFSVIHASRAALNLARAPSASALMRLRRGTGDRGAGAARPSPGCCSQPGCAPRRRGRRWQGWRQAAASKGGGGRGCSAQGAGSGAQHPYGRDPPPKPFPVLKSLTLRSLLDMTDRSRPIQDQDFRMTSPLERATIAMFSNWASPRRGFFAFNGSAMTKPVALPAESQTRKELCDFSRL